MGYCFECGKSVIDRSKNQIQYILSTTCFPDKLKFQVGLESEIFQTPEINMLSTEITSISPTIATLGDIITITGKYLYLYNGSGFLPYLTTGGVNCPIISASFSEIRFRVPHDLQIPSNGVVNAILYTCKKTSHSNLILQYH
jgi:hypothetical protein